MSLGGSGLVEPSFFITRSSRPRKRSVFTEPGLTALTWTPSRLPRSASAFMKASIAATTDAPTMASATGARGLVPPMKTTDPLPALSSGQANRLKATCAKNFRLNASRHSCSLWAKKPPRFVAPALLTRISRRPKSRVSASISPGWPRLRRQIDSMDRRLAGRARGSPPPRLPAPCRRAPVSMMPQPADANSSAMPRPMPRLAPVISATLPESSVTSDPPPGLPQLPLCGYPLPISASGAPGTCRRLPVAACAVRR